MGIMANVWVKAWDGRTIRESQVQQVTPARLKWKGWWVVAVIGRREEVILARTGRGMQAQFAAQRLAQEWPQAVKAAKPGDTISYEGGQWSTLAERAAANGAHNDPGGES